MNEIKRQRISTIDYSGENNIKKFQLTTINTKRLPSIHFEDLPNEVIYDIFEYLDAYHIYESFFNLNQRFQYLVLFSTIPLDINILSMSRSILYSYYTNFITPNIHRIRSLHVSHQLPHYFNILLSENISKFIQLETLILNNVELIYLKDILKYLISLPYLSSLIIIYDGWTSNKNIPYHFIFQLPSLKYCKMSFNKGFGSVMSSMNNNVCSPIEHLIIEGRCELDEFTAFLSYVPQLHHLSINLLCLNAYDQIEMFPIVLNNLIHVSIHLDLIRFYQFKLLVKKLFHNLQILHITTCYGEYLDDKQWEYLILNDIPNLRIFDIHYRNFSFNDIKCKDLMNKFTSLFWLERKWFFTHRHNWGQWSNRGIFYSTKPYRRKYYIINGKYDQNEYLYDEETNLNSVRHINIKDEEALINCKNFFPNITKLTISSSYRITQNLIINHFNRIIPLIQITILIIRCEDFPFKQLLEILFLTSNCHTLIFNSILLNENQCISLLNNNNFRLKIKVNSIKNLTIIRQHTLNLIKIFVYLCPRLQQFNINPSYQYLESVVQFILSEIKEHTRYLFLLRISELDTQRINKLDILIKSMKLLDRYSIKLINTDCYLYW